MTEKKESPSKEKFHQPTTSFVLANNTLGEMLYDKAHAACSFAVCQGGNITTVSQFETNTVLYSPYTAHNPLLTHRVLRLPENVEPYESTQQLKNDIYAFIRRYIELPDTEQHIAVHYVLLTWLYDKFNELPYLRVRGDFGTGKTRFLNVIGALCYKPIVASGASTVAPLFHILNQIGGTLILDEADFRFSSETADITKILNNGNAKGFPVMRCEVVSNKEFKPKAYTVFSPKIIATRNDYQDDALESRCISFDMGYKLKRDDVPLTLPNSFEDDATKLRNKLLKWRFDHFHKSLNIESQMSDVLENRLNQIYAPLLSLVDDENIKQQIIEFAHTHSEQARVDRGLKTEAELLMVIKTLSGKDKPITISQLTKQFIDLYGNRYDRRITPRWIGSIVRTRLRLATRKCSGNYIIAEKQHDKLEKLYDQFDVGL